MAARGEAINDQNEVVVENNNPEMGGPLDELIQYVKLYVRRPVILSGLVCPFLPLYLFVFYLWMFVYGLEEFHYKGLIAIVTIIIVHLLTILWCFWSAHVVAFVNCKRVQLPAIGVFAKVVPTMNHGSPRMVRIERSEYFDGTENYYFIFRRSQYVWDEEKAIFRRVKNELLCNISPSRNMEPVEIAAIV